MINPSLVSKVCNNIELMNFIIGSSMIHHGCLTLTINMENMLEDRLSDIKTDISTIKDDEQFNRDGILRDYISDIETFITKIEKAVSLSKDQRFIEVNLC